MNNKIAQFYKDHERVINNTTIVVLYLGFTYYNVKYHFQREMFNQVAHALEDMELIDQVTEFMKNNPAYPAL